MHPFFSIIIPVRNGERTLRACLGALLAQDYPAERREIIVVDNNSMDATAQLVAEYPVRLHAYRDSQSSYAARNAGVQVSKGEIVVFTDADCIVDPGWLRDYATAFQDPQALAVGGKIVDADPTNPVETFLASISPLHRYQADTAGGWKNLVTANAACRRAAFESIGGFNANLYTGGDIDFAWRLQIAHGDCIRFASGALVLHQHRSTLNGLYRQYRRYGFGEIMLQAMYGKHPQYPYRAAPPASRLPRQFVALATYIGSLTVRLLRDPLRRNPAVFERPYFWLVCESANVQGKLQGLWATRFLTVNPALRSWSDPGG